MRVLICIVINYRVRRCDMGKISEYDKIVNDNVKNCKIKEIL